MPTPTYDLIASTTLTASTSSITFGSLPSTYRDLIVVIDAGITSGAEAMSMRFNGDSGSNYHYILTNGNGSTTGGFVVSPTIFARLGSIYTGSNNFVASIMDYSATDKHKTVLARGNSAANAVFMTASRWANTAEITSLILSPDTGVATFTSGSTFSIYGVIS
jgi:hypothetical protein